jgi:hypothetical protein
MRLFGRRKKAVSREDIIWCYRTLLGRDPESEAAILDHAKSTGLRDLVEQFVQSQEFIENCSRGVSKDEIVWCYCTLLGREPESDAAIVPHIKAKNFKALVESFTGSAEFRSILSRATARARRVPSP